MRNDSDQPVVSAFVVLASQETMLMRAATTDESGEFSFPALPVGTYRLRIEADGFAHFTAKDIRASIGEVLRLSCILAPEAASGTQPSARPASSLVETGNAQIGVVMGESEVTQLPLKSRDTFELLQLQPGVQSTLGTNLFYGSDRPGVVSVSGGRTRSNEYNVNGGYSADQMVNSPSIQPSPDSVSEFRIISHNYEADLGRNSGSILNVVTKSGGSVFHGSAYEFLRNELLNAKGYFDPRLANFKQNEFGGTIGGPLRRDKTTFFASYEGRRERRGITSNPVPVPSSAERTGDFSAGAAFAGVLHDDALAQTLSNRPGCAAAVSRQGGAAIAAGTAYSSIFPGNTIPSQCFDATAADLLQQFVPLANAAGGMFVSGPEAAVRNDQVTLRADHALTGQQQATIYYYGSDQFDGEPFSYFLGVGANLPGFGTNTRTRYQQVNLSHSWNITAKAINEARLVFYREGEKSLQSPQHTALVQNSCQQVPASQCFNDPSNPELGIRPGYGAAYEGVPFVSLAGGFGYGNNPDGFFSQTGDVYQAQDTYHRTLSAHLLTLGADLRNQRLHQNYFYDINGEIEFLGGGPNDVGYRSLVPNYLLGLPDNFSEGSANAVDARTTQLNFFAQDAWKLRQNLTVSYGLRWEWNTPYEDAGRRVQSFRPGQATTVYPCVLGASDPISGLLGTSDCSPAGPARSVFPLGLVFPGDPGVPNGLTQNYFKQFAPRFGLSWSPGWKNETWSRLTGGPGRSSVRAGWGMFYDSLEELMFGENLTAQPPFGGSTSVNNGVFNTPFLGQDGSVIPNPFHGFLDPRPGSAVDFAQFRPITLYGILPPAFRTPYSIHYHLTIQRELTRSTLLQFGYVGSQGHRLTASLDQNYGIAQTCLDLNQVPGMSCGPYGADDAYTIPAGALPAGASLHLPYGSVARVTGPNATPITLVGLRPYSSPNCEPTTGSGCPPDGVPVFASIFGSVPIANSSYHSLQTVLSRHFAHGLQFLASDSWSKSIDDASSFENSINPLDPGRSRSLSLFHASHRFVFSGYWQLPGPRHVLGIPHLLDGWTLSSILTVQSGFPIRMTSSGDQELMSSANFESVGEPQQIAPFLRLDPQRSNGYYFSPQSFADAPLGQIGNTPRTLCCGPGIANVDLGVHKSFELTERTRLEFRTEVFNLMNHTQFLNPDGNITDGASFGRVSAARDPRLVQVAVRLTF
ncbi:MAG TPA: carboxypeptidase regulatory-like domain-containing protein [Candidatus Sulfotelmatobacter sp.]|nr:carboxypeptidase regulatory-like domain-containing protein [Candidatus Sulfotelmatobacter sp.]